MRERWTWCACYGVLRDLLWCMRPVRRVQRCPPGSIPPAPVVFVHVTKEPHSQGHDVSSSAPANI